MKVCILSMQKVQNMGSLLQSYSLKKLIEEMGHEVSFIDIERRDTDDVSLNGFHNVYLEENQCSEKCAVLKKIDCYFLNRVLMKIMIRKQNEKFNAFRSEQLQINDNLDKDTCYDCCVIGSDEVFNCCDDSPWGFTTQLFGDVKEAQYVFTYAASCGSTVEENIPDVAKNKIKDALNCLGEISVRDKNTEQFVKTICARSSQQHLDPVLVGDFSYEIEQCKMVFDLPLKYCVIYAYHNRIHNNEEIEAIKSFCKEHEMTLIAVGMPQFWIKNFIVTEPFQCLKIFQGAEFVITDTFHGTIFSAKYCEKFATVVRRSNRNKLQDLIDRLQISEHQVSKISYEELERTFKKTHDKENFNEFIKIERERTMSFLKRNFEK